MWRRRLRNNSSMAAPALALRWNRSATWIAAGAPCRPPSAQAPARSRTMISTPGWARSQLEDLGSAIVEQINGPMCFKVEQQSSVPALFLPK